MYIAITPLTSILPEDKPTTSQAEAIVTSPNLPPIPAKLAEKVWRKEYIAGREGKWGL